VVGKWYATKRLKTKWGQRHNKQTDVSPPRETLLNPRSKRKNKHQQRKGLWVQTKERPEKKVGTGGVELIEVHDLSQHNVRPPKRITVKQVVENTG